MNMFKPKSLFGQITMSFLGFAAAFLIVLYVNTLYHSSREMEQQMVRSSTEILEQTNGTVSQMLDNLSLMLDSTFMGPDVIRLAISPSLREFENMKAITSALTSSADSSTLIDSAYLYSARSDLGLSSDYTLSNYQDYSYAAVLARFQTKKNKMVPYEAHGTATYFYTENNDIYLIQGFSNIKYEKCSCYILFHLDSEQFYQTINSTGDESLMFFNASGMRMFLPKDTDTTLSDALYQRIKQEETGDGSFLYDWENGSCSHVIYFTDPFTGWTSVYVTQPVGKLSAHYLYSNELLVIAALAVCLFFLAASLWSAKRISRPISSLVQKVQATAGAEIPHNQSEWEYLELSYSHLLSQKEELEQYLPLAADSIHEQLFRDLLRREEINPNAVRQQLELIRSPFREELPCAVILISIELSEEAIPDRLAQELAVLSLRNKLQKIMEGQEIPYHIQTKSPADLCVICAFPGPQRQEEDYRRLREELSRLKLEMGKPVFGMGTPAPDLFRLADSMADAKNKLEFNRYHSDLPDMATSGERERTIYIGEIRNLLTTIRQEETDKLAGALLKLLYDIDRDVSGPGMKRQLYQLLIDLLLEQVKALKLECGGLDTSLKDVPEEGLCQAAERICGEIVNCLCVHFNSGQYLYISRAKEYVLSRCNDPNLSLESAAEYVGINSAYLSRIFKTIVQQNFNTYLNDCRVENAKKLLATSDMPAQEIGYLTGFCSVATFFRVFKKHTNMTPKQFRQSIDHKEEQP